MESIILIQNYTHAKSNKPNISETVFGISDSFSTVNMLVLYSVGHFPLLSSLCLL